MTCYHCHNSNRPNASHCHNCGQQLNWHGWTIARKLGEGGMGTAYLVQKHGKKAVLKIPLSPDPEAHLLECRNLYAAASYGVGPNPIMTSSSGIVMEYMKPPTGTLAQTLIYHFLKNINKMHNREMVHRDLKPQNIVGYMPIDFGSAVLLALDLAPKAIGTPGYAAPEAYQGIVDKSLDAYGAGWVIVNWLGGPDPDPNPQNFGPPQGWTPPTQWAGILGGLLQPDREKRLSIAQAYHQITGNWCQLSDGTQVRSDLVTVKEWQQVTGKPSSNTCGYATNLAEPDIQLFLQKTNSRLPSKGELLELASGTEKEKSWKTHPSQTQHGLTSDLGARNCRRFLWQPTCDGWLWGGTPYAQITEMAQAYQPNAMIGLRVVKK